MIDFRIYTFLSVCKYLNFTRAAEELCITQPAVSQHIRYLEEHFKTKLFEHSGKSISISKAGLQLQKKALALCNDENILLSELKSNNPVENSFKFGVTMTIGEFIIAKPLAAYLKKNPNAKIQMTMSNTHVLLQKLKEGQIDFALIEGFFPKEEFDFLVYSSESFVPICSPKKNTENIHMLKDLTNERLIIREKGSGTRNILEKALDVRNLSVEQFSNAIEISSMNTIIKLVEEDCGISFLYKAAVEKKLNDNKIKLINLSDFLLKHDFCFVWNKGSIYKEEYQNLFAALKSTE